MTVAPWTIPLVITAVCLWKVVRPRHESNWWSSIGDYTPLLWLILAMLSWLVYFALT